MNRSESGIKLKKNFPPAKSCPVSLGGGNSLSVTEGRPIMSIGCGGPQAVRQLAARPASTLLSGSLTMKKLLLAAMLLIPLVGCGSQTLDTSSKQSFESSMQAMADGLSDADKQKFGSAVATIAMGDAFASAINDEEFELHTAAKGLHGLTADQIIAKAKEFAEE